MAAPALSRSLTRQTLIQVAIRIALVVAVATVISYFHVNSSLQTQALEHLEKYITQRGMRESAIFLLARDNLKVFSREYVHRLGALGDTDPVNRFEQLFTVREDGSTRLREAFFISDGLTGVIGKHVDIDAHLRRRLVVAFEMLARYGPAWQNRFVNLYITTPESAILMHWPGKPWGLNANSWEVQARLALSAPGGGDDILIIGESPDSIRESSWSDLYFDYAVNDWMVSTTEPISLDERYMMSVGHDMLLHELIERVISNRLEGTYNLIFRDDGLLLAHPRFMDAIQARNSGLSITEAGDANLLRIFSLVQQRATGTVIIDNHEDEEYLAVSRLQGPGWYLVTVFPKGIIASQAFKTARLILLLGAMALLLEIAILFFVLKRQVATPLTNLLDATNRVAAGDFDIRLDERRKDEIGRLAQSFNTMSKEINAREVTLSERGAKLALLNEQLEQELEERKRAEEEVHRQRETLHQSEKLSALGSLLAGVAHELNNPLSVVVGRAIMMEGEATQPSLKDKARKIRQAAERCARIVKTFLAIARQQAPERAQVQLNGLVEAALELVGYGLRTADIEVKLKLDANLPELSADADQMTQVFTNLIINAQHALQDIPPPRRLDIVSYWQRDTGMVHIEFSDNGPGVPEEVRTRIFEPFYTSKPVGIGTGIGLSFSYGVVQSHDGKLALQESEEGGARFIIMLPLSDTPVSEELESEDTVFVDEVDSQQAILVVDDEPEIAELLTEILAEEGHRIDVAESGNAALRRLAENEYSLILSDLKMPDLDGPGLYQQLEQSHAHLLGNIIFITGDTLGSAASTFLARSGCRLIEKPFIPREVIQIVRQTLSQAESG